MFRAAVLSALVCLSAFASAQTTNSNQPESSSALQLVYVIDGSTLTTYNIDTQTLQPTQVGTTTLPESVYPGIIPSPNGHILYYIAYENYSQQGKRLYVYNTDSSGVPQGEPIQRVDAKGLYSLVIDPTDKYLYITHEGTSGGQYTNFTIIRYLIDSTTGKISQPVVEASYHLLTESSGEDCAASLIGMNAAGTKLYDGIGCYYPGGGSATYYERTVDPATGALGPDQQVYGWNNASSGGDRVFLVKDFVFAFIIPNNYQQNADVVDVYPLKPNTTKPLISCTASMLAECGDFELVLVHPSAKYLFITNGNGVADIDQVDLSSKQIVATSSTIPYEVQQFSPDGSIAYAANDINTALNIQIYGFDVSNAAITPGGVISVPSDLDSWFAVERR
jgi:hypothetical protein